MKTQFCPLCGPKKKKQLLYRQNFKLSQINSEVFSARRKPDRLHYQMVRCSGCGLVYSDPILPSDQINRLYQKSRFTYTDRSADLVKTYGYYLKQLDRHKTKKNRLLEIGCGNGFFLQEARRQGYRQVWGVEPSRQAAGLAPDWLKQKIKITVFKPNLFPKNYFDVICFFQTFDHIIDPNRFLKECYRILKPGGLVLAINHNVESLPAKLLRSYSPIIDVEHAYLYSLKTMQLIFAKHGFQVLKTAPSFNYYPLDYLAHLLSLPFFRLPFKFKFWLGNLHLIARKKL